MKILFAPFTLAAVWLGAGALAWFVRTDELKSPWLIPLFVICLPSYLLLGPIPWLFWISSEQREYALLNTD